MKRVAGELPSLPATITQRRADKIRLHTTLACAKGDRLVVQAGADRCVVRVVEAWPDRGVVDADLYAWDHDGGDVLVRKVTT